MQRGFDTDLWVGKMVEGLLIGSVGLLEVVLHEIAVTEGAPDFAVFLPDVERALEEVDGLGCRGEWVQGDIGQGS